MDRITISTEFHCNGCGDEFVYGELVDPTYLENGTRLPDPNYCPSCGTRFESGPGDEPISVPTPNSPPPGGASYSYSEDSPEGKAERLLAELSHDVLAELIQKFRREGHIK